MLTPEEHKLLDGFVKRHGPDAPYWDRVQIVLLTAEGMTQEQIGVFADEVCQSLQLSRTEVPMQAAAGRFQAERDGWCELSGWIARHPEFLS